MTESEINKPVIKKNARFYLGMTCFVLAWVTPLFIPLVLKLPISSAAKGTISTLLLVGGPEVFGLAAIALLGKENLQYFLGRIKALFRRKAPPRPVGRTRYAIGLLMFWIPTLLSIAEFRFESVRAFYGEHYVAVSIAWDIVFLLSLFVLGANFWDKFRSLFVHDAHAVFPGRSSDTSTNKENDT